MTHPTLFDFLDEPDEEPGKKPKRKIVKKSTSRRSRDEKAAEESPETEAVPETPPPVARPLSVTELTVKVKGTLESNFNNVWVVGEISNLSLPRSGHVYLTLKDQGAQLPAVVWKTAASKLRFKLTDGMELIVRGRLDVYPPQGKYQLIVSQLEPKGVGALELAFRQLHDRLEREGLFALQRKKPLPRAIRNVALITSPSGAAARDFLQVLQRRTRLIDVLFLPVAVQGAGAAEEIAGALRTVHHIARHRPIDCIVVTRGGGSMEDLWAFNEEVLVRAVAGSSIPVVSGVGHEIDVTLCDLAADVRALTPSEAAERVAPDDAGRIRELLQYRVRLDDSVEKFYHLARERFRFVENHSVFVRPERLVEDKRRSVDMLEEKLDRVMDRRLETATQKLEKTAAALETLSPLAVLSRGYSLTETIDGGRVGRIDQLQAGDRMRTRLADGIVESLVQTVLPKTDR